MRLMGIRATLGMTVGVVAVLALVVSLVALFNYGRTTDSVRKNNGQISELKAENMRLRSELTIAASMERPSLIATNDTLAFPEFHIAIPFNDKSKTLLYSIDPEGDIRVTSSLTVDTEVRQLSCNELVRISLTRSTPYSPWEESAGSVTLGDGRTLHIIASKAYKNDQASTEECAQVWQQFTPQQAAETFKQARAY